MKTTTHRNVSSGIGALSLLVTALAATPLGCVADRPSRNAVFDENQYLRKDWLVRPGDSTSPDYGWLLKATVTEASEPNVFGGDVYGLYAGAHSDGELVHFVVTPDHLQMLDNRGISSVPSAGTTPEVVNAWPITNVDLKYLINANGEKTNTYGESEELDWQVRQWVKIAGLEHNDMSDLTPLGSFTMASLATCVSPEGSSTLVPNSFVVDEAHDYMEWTVQLTIPISWSDTCVESYGALGAVAQRLGRQYETVNLKYSMVRANPSPLTGTTSYAENASGTRVPAYQPLIVAEKDQILHKYSPFIFYSWNETRTRAPRLAEVRCAPATRRRTSAGTSSGGFRTSTRTSSLARTSLPAWRHSRRTSRRSKTRRISSWSRRRRSNPSATGRISFHEFDEPLDDGTPIQRAFGDVRFNMVRWIESLDQRGQWAGSPASRPTRARERR